MYMLIINGKPEGPYTRTECRDRVREVFGGDFYWESKPDGSQVARRPNYGEELAEAVPVD